MSVPSWRQRAMSLGAALSVSLLAACASAPKPALVVPAPAYASYFDKLPCVDRIGRCFDASIAGQPVTVIAEAQRHEELTRQAQTVSNAIRDIYWELAQPVDGHKVFDIVATVNALGQAHVGVPKEAPDIVIYPLDGQKMKSRSEAAAVSSVRVNGKPVLTQQNTLNQNFLPSGRYALAIRYQGVNNWDQKLIFLRVQ